MLVRRLVTYFENFIAGRTKAKSAFETDDISPQPKQEVTKVNNVCSMKVNINKEETHGGESSALVTPFVSQFPSLQMLFQIVGILPFVASRFAYSDMIENVIDRKGCLSKSEVGYPLSINRNLAENDHQLDMIRDLLDKIIVANGSSFKKKMSKTENKVQAAFENAETKQEIKPKKNVNHYFNSPGESFRDFIRDERLNNKQKQESQKECVSQESDFKQVFYGPLTELETQKLQNNQKDITKNVSSDALPDILPMYGPLDEATQQLIDELKAKFSKSAKLSTVDNETMIASALKVSLNDQQSIDPLCPQVSDAHFLQKKLSISSERKVFQGNSEILCPNQDIIPDSLDESKSHGEVQVITDIGKEPESDFQNTSSEINEIRTNEQRNSHDDDQGRQKCLKVSSNNYMPFLKFLNLTKKKDLNTMPTTLSGMTSSKILDTRESLILEKGNKKIKKYESDSPVELRDVKFFDDDKQKSSFENCYLDLYPSIYRQYMTAKVIPIDSEVIHWDHSKLDEENLLKDSQQDKIFSDSLKEAIQKHKQKLIFFRKREERKLKKTSSREKGFETVKRKTKDKSTKTEPYLSRRMVNRYVNTDVIMCDQSTMTDNWNVCKCCLLETRNINTLNSTPKSIFEIKQSDNLTYHIGSTKASTCPNLQDGQFGSKSIGKRLSDCFSEQCCLGKNKQRSLHKKEADEFRRYILHRYVNNAKDNEVEIDKSNIELIQDISSHLS